MTPEEHFKSLATVPQEILDESVESTRRQFGNAIANRLNQYYNGVLCKCKGANCRLATGIHWSFPTVSTTQTYRNLLAVGPWNFTSRGSLVARLCKEVKQ